MSCQKFYSDYDLDLFNASYPQMNPIYAAVRPSFSDIISYIYDAAITKKQDVHILLCSRSNPPGSIFYMHGRNLTLVNMQPNKTQYTIVNQSALNTVLKSYFRKAQYDSISIKNITTKRYIHHEKSDVAM